jgi:acetyl esterase
MVKTILQRPLDVADLPLLEPATQLFVEAMAAAGRLPPGEQPPDEARKFVAELQSTAVGKPGARLRDVVLPVGPTGEVRVRIVRPEGAGETLPAVVYAHGGGWMFCGHDTHDRLVRELAVGARAALFFVDFDRAPEARYPVAVEQVYAVARYVAEHGADLAVDPTRLAIAGDCTGGNLAAAVAILAKARRGPKIALQLLFYPVIAASFETASHAAFAKGPWLTRRAMERFWDAYLPNAAARQEITAAPLTASIDALAGLPDALVIVAESDVVRDEGEAYANNLARAGVRVVSTRYNGTIHDFMTLNALADTPAARGAIAQATDFLRSALD